MFGIDSGLIVLGIIIITSIIFLGIQLMGIKSEDHTHGGKN